MRVVAFGRVSVYPRDGQYQLYCTQMFPDGQGELNAAFQRLKEKLAAEGLFDEAAKRPLPRFPRKIALVTSPAGAAVRDMLRILKARWPIAQVMIVPVRVQGEEAAGEIAAAIHAVNNRDDVDLIITGRGGGSMEDLWAFNEEVVARAVYVSNIPVISAVGHEPDVTIADYVADLRAATPSNGAELAVPDQNELRQALDQLQVRLGRTLLGRLANQRGRLERLKEARVLRSMTAPIEDRRARLAELSRRLPAGCGSALARGRSDLEARQGRLNAAAPAVVAADRAKLARLCAALEAMSPLKVLARGYAAARTEGGVLSSVDQAERGDRVELILTDGRLMCRVEEKERSQWKNNSH